MYPHAVSTDLAAIERIRAAWDAGWLNGDAQALAALFSEGAVLMPQNAPEIVGKDAIHALYESVFATHTIAGSGMMLEMQVAGEWAFFRSTYTLTALPKAGGKPMADRGKWLCIVQRQPDSSWKIARLIVNSDLPPGDA